MKSTVRFSIIVLAATLALPSWGADLVTEAVQAAYAPYRVALFRTNGKSQPEARQAMAQAQQSWASLIARFGDQPPAPYDRDNGFSKTLNEVTAVYDKAAGEVEAGKLSEAHESLEAARELIAAMRQRNGVVVFSDHMNAYHSEMERLLSDGPKWLAGPQGTARLAAQAGVLDYLARQLRTQAPPALLQDAEFDSLLRAVEHSVLAVKNAAFAGDSAALKEAVSQLKVPYSRLFLKFG